VPQRIAIVGNSGSGKSTLARALAGDALPVLDLDTIVWEPGKVAVPRDGAAVAADLERFCAGESWIVEGCYGGLIERALMWTPELVFVNPGEATCVRHCRERPWEPHKYASKELQDAQLPMLLAWVADYYRRSDDMSLARHRALFDAYRGPKREVVRARDMSEA
jgi:adenylate kinase family enzyme